MHHVKYKWRRLYECMRIIMKFAFYNGHTNDKIVKFKDLKN